MNNRDNLILLREFIEKNKGDFLVKLFIEGKLYELGDKFLLNNSNEVIEYLSKYGEVEFKWK